MNEGILKSKAELGVHQGFVSSLACNRPLAYQGPCSKVQLPASTRMGTLVHVGTSMDCKPLGKSFTLISLTVDSVMSTACVLILSVYVHTYLRADMYLHTRAPLNLCDYSFQTVALIKVL